jgi:quinohemoprotein ethanol dehydrogenase
VHPRRLLTFALDATARLPPTSPRKPAVPLEAPEFMVDAGKAKAGEREYAKCVLCHGMGVVAGGIAPDLRASPVPLSAEAWAPRVRDGSLLLRGMPRYAELDDGQLGSLRHSCGKGARRPAAQTKATPASPR